MQLCKPDPVSDPVSLANSPPTPQTIHAGIPDMARRTKQKFTEGTIVQIPYGDGQQAYAQMLVDPWIRVFYGLAGQSADDLESLVARPERFRLCVFGSSIRDGRWPVIGHVPLRPEDREIPDQFVQDLVQPKNLRLYSSTPDGEWSERPATVAECEGLEALSVWTPEHVEERLIDEDAGVPNLSLLSMRLVCPGEVFTIMLDRGQNADGHWVASGKAHADVHPHDKVRLGSAHGPLLTVAVIAPYVDEGTLPSLSSGKAGTLLLAGDIPPDARSARVLLAELH